MWLLLVGMLAGFLVVVYVALRDVRDAEIEGEPWLPPERRRWKQ